MKLGRKERRLQKNLALGSATKISMDILQPLKTLVFSSIS